MRLMQVQLSVRILHRNIIHLGTFSHCDSVGAPAVDLMIMIITFSLNTHITRFGLPVLLIECSSGASTIFLSWHGMPISLCKCEMFSDQMSYCISPEPQAMQSAVNILYAQRSSLVSKDWSEFCSFLPRPYSFNTSVFISCTESPEIHHR